MRRKKREAEREHFILGRPLVCPGNTCLVNKALSADVSSAGSAVEGISWFLSLTSPQSTPAAGKNQLLLGEIGSVGNLAGY